MTLQELPSEIVQQILEHLYRSDLGNLLYTCKKWHPIVKSIYFEQVTWSIERIKWLKMRLAAMSETGNDMQIFQQLHMTKRLLIHFDVDRQGKTAFGFYTSPSTQFTEKEFLYLLTLFPNLKNLDITQSTHREHYLEILCNSASTDLPPLEEIVTEKEYLEDEDEASRQLKFEACYRFRHSLKCMTVIYIDNLRSGKSFVESLSDFSRLERLEIYNDTDPDLTLFHLLEACPSLSTLTYTSTFEPPEDAMQQLEGMIQKLKNENSSISHFVKNLKKLKLVIPWLTAPYMNFFIKHKPKSLDHVIIQSKQMGMYGWVMSETIDAVLDFCKSLQKLNSVTLSFDEESVIDHGEIDIFYQVLDTLTGSREFQTRWAIHKDREELNSSGVEIEIDGTELYYEYCFDIEEFICDYAGESSQPTPSALSLKQLALVTKFHIWTEDYFFESSGVPYFYLEYARKFLPKIRFFQYQNTSKNCFLEAECLFNDQSLQKMTQVSLQGYAYPQVALNDIPAYFPRIETLSFVLDFQNEEANFELSSFEHLHTLILGVEYISHCKNGPVFFQYMNINQQATLYLLKTRKAQNGDVIGINFESVSADKTQQLLERSDTYGCIITVQGANQLKKVELKHYDRTYANIEL